MGRGCCSSSSSVDLRNSIAFPGLVLEWSIIISTKLGVALHACCCSCCFCCCFSRWDSPKLDCLPCNRLSESGPGISLFLFLWFGLVCFQFFDFRNSFFEFFDFLSFFLPAELRFVERRKLPTKFRLLLLLDGHGDISLFLPFEALWQHFSLARNFVCAGLCSCDFLISFPPSKFCREKLRESTV